MMMVPLLIGITFLTFLIMQLAPGRPTDMVTDLNTKMSPDAKQKLIALYGLDQPYPVQYLSWIKRTMRLDFGRSFKDERPVIQKISERLPATLLLNILSLGVIVVLALFIGLISALYKNSIFDRLCTVGVYIGFSAPTFWIALLCMIFFGLKLGWLPISGLHSFNYDSFSATEKIFDVLKHLVMPVLVGALTGLASLSRYMRSSAIEIIRQDYIRAATARGVSKSGIIFHHVFKNALIPVVTLLGLMLPDLIGGSFIFETIFAYPGMGRLGYDAIMARDYPVLMGIGTIVAFLTLFGNLVADICYAWADPRIRYR